MTATKPQPQSPQDAAVVVVVVVELVALAVRLQLPPAAKQRLLDAPLRRSQNM
jgi:hypothetical protein